MPELAVSVCPCWATPVMAGSAEFTAIAAITVAVVAVAVAVPPVFVAVTTSWIVWPTSVAATAYVVPVPTAVQVAPLQLDHA